MIIKHKDSSWKLKFIANQLPGVILYSLSYHSNRNKKNRSRFSNKYWDGIDFETNKVVINYIAEPIPLSDPELLVSGIGVGAGVGIGAGDSLINEESIYVFVEEMLTYIGVNHSLQIYLKRAISKIDWSTRNKIKGKVWVKFVVTCNGNIYRPTIFKGVSKDVNQEAIKIVSSFSSWKPGKQKGEPSMS